MELIVTHIIQKLVVDTANDNCVQSHTFSFELIEQEHIMHNYVYKSQLN